MRISVYNFIFRLVSGFVHFKPFFPFSINVLLMSEALRKWPCRYAVWVLNFEVNSAGHLAQLSVE